MSLTAEHVFHLYRRRRAAPIQALDDVSVSIPTGSFTGLIGPNGCGKSTLLRLLAGIDRPAGGDVRWTAATSPATRAASTRAAWRWCRRKRIRPSTTRSWTWC
jgi:ABC-type cobalamin/Fe3+-siderophores transport system ATPase subunit